MSSCLQNSDFDGVVRELSLFWELKKKMAEDAEPPIVQNILSLINPHIAGLSLAGAGGGGFICLLTKQPGMIDTIRKELVHLAADGISIHSASINTEGMRTEILEQQICYNT